MREIKFRFWNVNIKRYVTLKHIPNNINSESIGYITEQFTGLKDKNGIEIYEADILRKTIELEGGLIGNWIVYYGEAGFDIKNVYDSVEVKTMYLKHYWKHTYEVIGNIHENPDLLTQHKN